MRYEEYTDDDLIAELEELDGCDDPGFTDWETEFVDSVLGKWRQYGKLTEGQRTKIIEILRERG